MQNIKQIINSNLPEIKTLFPDSPSFEKYIHIERGADAKPLVIFIPKTSDELQKIILFLNKIKLGAVIFAGNTGLVSAQRAFDEAVIDLNELNNLIALEFNDCSKLNFAKISGNHQKKADHWFDELKKFIEQNPLQSFKGAKIITEAGVPLGTINYVISQAKIEVPVDTGAVGVAWGMSAGAAVANASHGTYGLLYGKASDLAVNVKSINGNGSKREDILDIKTIKTSDDEVVINSAKAQYGDSSIGTQGTFAIITEVTFKTKPLPYFRDYFVLKLNDLSKINEIKKELQNKFPQSLLQFEIMDRFSIELVKRFEPDNYKNPFNSGDDIGSNYLLMLQVIGGQGEENKGEQVYEYLNSQLGFSDDEIAFANENINDPEDIIKLRHSISGASTKYANSLGSSVQHRITPDLSVPPKNIIPFMNDIKNYCAANSHETAIFGHVGIGSFHIHVFSKTLLEGKNDKLITGLFDITKKYNGSCWSEHGIGTANAKYYNKYTDAKFVSEWLSYKKKHDPNNILSPRSNGFF